MAFTIIKGPKTIILFAIRRYFSIILTVFTASLIFYLFLSYVFIDNEYNVMVGLSVRKAIKEKMRLQYDLFSKINNYSRALDKAIYFPVLILACNREEVRRPIEQLIRMKSERQDSHRFPLFISHACDHERTASVINSFSHNAIVLIPSSPLIVPNLTTPSGQKNANSRGYSHISLHYKWALDQILVQMNFDSVIIVEDDLDLAPDFLEYFLANYPFLVKYPDKLFCISAYNDNGRSNLIDMNAHETLYKTDFFPGLGWMMLRTFWLEIRPNWPIMYWDDYIRNPSVRKSRSCIRPELSRSVTFGKRGVSNGQYYHAYLKFVVLNTKYVKFTELDLTYLHEPDYTRNWLRRVHFDSQKIVYSDLVNKTIIQSNSAAAFSLTYRTKQEFQNIAKLLNLMPDFKAGVVRGAYKGALTVMYGKKRLYITIPQSWPDYNVTWS